MVQILWGENSIIRHRNTQGMMSIYLNKIKYDIIGSKLEKSQSQSQSQSQSHCSVYVGWGFVVVQYWVEQELEINWSYFLFILFYLLCSQGFIVSNGTKLKLSLSLFYTIEIDANIRTVSDKNCFQETVTNLTQCVLELPDNCFLNKRALKTNFPGHTHCKIIVILWGKQKLVTTVS